MAFDVFVYDHSMTPLNNSRIEFLESDSVGTVISLQTNAAIGTAFGAVLPPPAAPVPIIIWIRDRSRTWAPASIGYLKGSVGARLHVTLFPIPSPAAAPGSGGGGPGHGAPRGPSPRSPGGASGLPATSPEEIAALIETRVRENTWTWDEGNGVRSMVDIASRALLLLALDEPLSLWLDEWLHQLAGFGISLRRETARSGNQSGSPPIVVSDPREIAKPRYMTEEA